MSVSGRRDKRVGFHHDKPPLSPSIDVSGVHSFLSDDSRHHYSVTEPVSADIAVRYVQISMSVLP